MTRENVINALIMAGALAFVVLIAVVVALYGSGA